MLKKILFFGWFLSLFSISNAQTTLTAGDMAIIGLNYDTTPYEMAIINLVPLTSGTEIRITDYAYDEATGLFSTVSTSNTAEGSIQWVLTSPMAAGTVTKFTIDPTSGTPVISGLPGSVSVTGWTNTTTTSCPSSAGGDNWFIFQGSSPTNVTTYIFAWCNPFAITHNGIPQVAGQFLQPGSGANNNGNSYLPSSLILGTNAISLSYDPGSGGYHGDNNIYIGPKTGTKATLITAISTISNWNRNETTTYDLNPGGTNFIGPNPIFNITAPNSSPTDITLSTNSINENVPANSTIGTLSSTDPDSGNTFTYSLVSGTGSTNNAAFNISGNNLRINSSPDFEIQNSFSVRIRTTDQGGLFFEKQFTITINNLCDIVLTPLYQTNVACNGGANGAASVNTPSGGAGGYTYNWTPGNPTGDGTTSVTGLTAGTWTCTVTDANSCQTTQNFTITQPTAIDNSVTLNSGILTANQTSATYQWYQCPNTILSSETNQTFTPTVVGDYKVEISIGGCTNTSSCVTVTTLESNNFDTTNFVYYPNPTSDILHITNGNLIEKVEVSNMLGQQVIYSKFISKEIQINLSALPTSTYFVKIISEGKSKTIKILKQ